MRHTWSCANLTRSLYILHTCEIFTHALHMLPIWLNVCYRLMLSPAHLPCTRVFACNPSHCISMQCDQHACQRRYHIHADALHHLHLGMVCIHAMHEGVDARRLWPHQSLQKGTSTGVAHSVLHLLRFGQLSCGYLMRSGIADIYNLDLS